MDLIVANTQIKNTKKMNIEKIKSNLHENFQLFERSGYYWIAESEYLSEVCYIKFDSKMVKIGVSFINVLAFKVSELDNPEDFILQLQKGLIAKF